MIEWFDGSWYGLVRWAYFGALFLAMGTIFTAMAGTVSRRNISKKQIEDVATNTNKSVKKGVTKALEGTKQQIDAAYNKINHPIQDLYDYINKNHQEIQTQLTGKSQILVFLDGVIKKKDIKNFKLEGMENVTSQEYSIAKNRTSLERTGYVNKYRSSIVTLDRMIMSIDDGELKSLYNVYKAMMSDIEMAYSKTISGDIEIDSFNTKISHVNAIYNHFVSKVIEFKNEKLESQ